MDIIDIMLAKAMTPQGKTEAYVAKAEKAAQKASQAEASAAAAIQTVESAADEIATAKSEANDLLATAQETLATAQEAQINMPEVYTTTGQNTDGYMTQKAVTDALATKADSSILNIYVTTNEMNTALASKADASTTATKTYVDEKIAAIPTSGGEGGAASSLDLGDENSGKIVVVGDDGNITSGIVSEDDIIEALIVSGGYTAKDALGLEVDYENKTFIRTQEAVDKEMGTAFDAYRMFGGRKRCNVSDNGEITAFYGDANYAEDGSNGQVMVYQPKFYYQRIPISTTSNRIGKTVMRDSIIISTTPQSGFKVHPIFVTPADEELDYVLFSAYEGGVEDVSEHTYATTTATNIDFAQDKLTSIVNTKPVTGSSGLSLQKAEQLANNRGAGWHIHNIKAESANQILEIVEFGTLNSQAALGKGICNLNNTGDANAAALTGSTSALGNASGTAAQTTVENSGTTEVTTDADKLAISYRGVENPWGNVWQMLNGILITGDTTMNGGIPCICTNDNYSYTYITNDYERVDFSLPNTSGWISAFGFGNKKYDWLFMPADCNASANSALPIGDSGWFDANLNGVRMVVQGGGWSFNESDGLFYYGCDKQPIDSTYRSYGARLLYIPTKNSIYTANIAKWQQVMGA